MEKFIRLINSLSQIGGYIAAVSVLLMLGMIIIHVFARRVINSPLLFGEEISSYFMLSTIFLGMGYTMKEGGHVRVELVLERVRGRAKAIVQIVCTFLAVLFSSAFFVGNLLMFRDFYIKHSISNVYLQLPLVIPGILLPIGSLLLLLQLLAMLFSLGNRSA